MWAVLLASVIATSCGEAPSDRHDSAPAADAALADTLASLIAEAYDFERPGAVERMTALYPSAGRVVSASGGHVIASRDSLHHAIAVFWENVGSNMRAARWEWGPVQVERLGPDAAVLTGTWRIPHIAPNDEPHVIGGAWTAVFRRMDGEWKIVQEHLSVPRTDQDAF